MSESNQGVDLLPDEVADYALRDLTMPGWTEVDEDNEHMPGIKFWFVKAGPFYIGVQPMQHTRRSLYDWWVSQGIGDDPDDDARLIKRGKASDPEQARRQAGEFFNRTARHRRVRR